MLLKLLELLVIDIGDQKRKREYGERVDVSPGVVLAHVDKDSFFGD